MRAYEAIKADLPGITESLETVRLVHEYREYWRPERVGRKTRVVLLAESHAYTPDAERLPTADLRNLFLASYPQDFVRFVYCLGYGEDDLLLYPVPGNTGTPQFWKVFLACIHPINDNRSFAPVQKSGCPSLVQRLKNKIRLLRTMQERGIWLLDAGIIALNRDKNNVSRQVALEISWREHIRPTLDDLKPECVIVIGGGVGDALGGRLADLPFSFEVFAGPQARMPAEEHMRQYKRYYELCMTYAA
jgi:hypothetical protein